MYDGGCALAIRSLAKLLWILIFVLLFYSIAHVHSHSTWDLSSRNTYMFACFFHSSLYFVHTYVRRTLNCIGLDSINLRRFSRVLAVIAISDKRHHSGQYVECGDWWSVNRLMLVSMIHSTVVKYWWLLKTVLLGIWGTEAESRGKVWVGAPCQIIGYTISRTQRIGLDSIKPYGERFTQ